MSWRDVTRLMLDSEAKLAELAAAVDCCLPSLQEILDARLDDDPPPLSPDEAAILQGAALYAFALRYRNLIQAQMTAGQSAPLN